MILTAPRLLAVGTHHKTGTLWMRAVFRRLAGRLDLPEHAVYPRTPRAKVDPGRSRALLTSWSSRFPDWLLGRPDARILHLIRDPRDVLLSGMRYHLHAGERGEQFLHAARDDLDGRTYQQHLNALEGDVARLRFEMAEKHAETLAEMRAWDYGRPNVVEARYEALMADTEGRLFREHLRDLGLPEAEVDAGVAIFWEQSLFGGLADPAARAERVAAHVASGRVAQWRERLPRPIAEDYAERHGDDLVALGYEDHPTAWLSEVRHAA